MALHSDKPWVVGDFCIYPLALPAELENDQLRLHAAEKFAGEDQGHPGWQMEKFIILVGEAIRRGCVVNVNLQLQDSPCFGAWRKGEWKKIPSGGPDRTIFYAIRFDWHGVQVTSLEKEVADAARKIFPGFDPEAAQKSIREWMDNHILKIGDNDPDWGWARKALNSSLDEFKAWEKRRWNEAFPPYGGNVDVQ